MIVAELDIRLSNITFWSDSAAALGYIRNRKTRFAVYVGNRVSEIQSTTRIEDWRHCPTSLNVADGLTRGHFPVSSSDPYFGGPEYLRLSPDQWPNDLGQTYDELIDPTDIRRDQQVMFADVPIFSHVTDFFPKFGSFQRLIAAVGWLLRFRTFCLDRQAVSKTPYLTVDEEEEAELAAVNFLPICRMESFVWVAVSATLRYPFHGVIPRFYRPKDTSPTCSSTKRI